MWKLPLACSLPASPPPSARRLDAFHSLLLCRTTTAIPVLATVVKSLEFVGKDFHEELRAVR